MDKSLCVAIHLLTIVLCCKALEENYKTEHILPPENLTKSNLIKFEDNCNKTITESQFLLQSPNYPDNYLPNLNCEVTLQGQSCPLYYKFRFLDFNIQNSTGCIKDRLEIDHIDAICGLKNGSKTYIARNGSLKLRFITDDSVSNTGYKILVTRIEECLNSTEKIPNFVLTTINRSNPVDENLNRCCFTSFYDSKRFTLRSPNFPLSMSQPNDCVYQIQKASPDICRLRIRFHFFWLGNSLDCKEGFFEINGKVICGCKKELNLLTVFIENIKTLRFKSSGIVKNSYSGYIAEVFQDECPKKLESKLFEGFNKPRSDERHSTMKYVPFTPRRKADIFFFTYPEDITYQDGKEETNFVETENINEILGNVPSNYEACLRWNQGQFDIISAQKNDIDDCRRHDNKINENACISFAQRKGIFFSPGYPFFYPGNLHMCYRFPKLPGQCAIRIHFLDFRISYSEGCFQDRLEIESIGAMCGLNLWNKIITIDLRNKDYEDLIFTTTSPKCVQGFKAIYEQIPCQEITTELPPLPPYTRIQPSEPTTIKPSQNCGGIINEKIFTIAYDGSALECRYVIRNFKDDACRLTLYFEQYFLDCAVESLTINGENFCGNQTGKRVKVQNNLYPTEVIYSRLRHLRQGTKFVISGMQYCEAPEPPAQLSK